MVYWIMAKLDSEDLQAIKDLMKQTLEEGVEEFGLVTKADIKHLPTKDEFYGSQDNLIAELKTIRQEQPLLSRRVSEHEDRISALEVNLSTAK